MAKTTVLPLEITVTNPPTQVDLAPAHNTTSVQPLSVTITGGTVTVTVNPAG